PAPGVPGAEDDATLEIAFAQRAATVDASIVDRVERTVDIEEGEILPFRLDDPALPDRHVLGHRDPHATPSHSRPLGSALASRASDFAPSETPSQMIVDHAGGLHESVADRRAHESEASREEIPAHGPRSIGLGRALPLPPPGVAHGPAVDEPPDVRVEASVLTLDRQERPRVGDRGIDLRAVADDPGAVHETADSHRGIAGDFLRVEPVEGPPIGLPLLQNRGPAQSGLRALENQELEEETVPMDRHAPLPIVIGGLHLSSSPPPPS